MWLYKGKELTEDDVPAKMIGFIYLITQVSTGRKYLGKKLLTKAATKTVNGKKKKIRLPSDWQNYWSSSPSIKEMIESTGTDDFTKEILTFCQSKGSLAACEEMALYSVGALESDQWLNQNIRSKIYSSWVKPDDMSKLRQSLKSKGIYL
jgi:hypothetical protein